MESKVDYYKKNPWYVIITEDNKKVLSKWRFSDIKNCSANLDSFINGTCGLTLWDKPRKLAKGHDAEVCLFNEDYNIGMEISFDEFKEYVICIDVEDESYTMNSLIKLLKNID